MSGTRPKGIDRRSEDHDDEGHADGERWLITYADMITLLMAFFIMLFTMSQVDLAKFQQFQEGMQSAGGGEVVLAGGGAGVFEGAVTPVVAPDAGVVPSEATVEPSPGATTTPAPGTTPGLAEGSPPAATVESVRAALDLRLAERGLTGTVAVRSEPRGLVLTVLNDAVLFDTGSADLRPDGLGTLEAIAQVLRPLTNELIVEGHTDDVPTRGGRYPSNWELSMGRAGSVVHFLVDGGHVAPSRLSGAGYADQRPLAPNDTPAHRAQNRRVEIVVASVVRLDQTDAAAAATDLTDAVGGAPSAGEH